jgi:ABC-type branched-subunit amino acid transport system substrate-binding protein
MAAIGRRRLAAAPARLALICVALILLMAPDAMNGAAAQLSGQEIRIGVGGPLTTGSATFGVEMRQAVDLAVAEANAAGGVLGAKVVAVAADDEASNPRGEAVARQFCGDPAVLGVVGHVNSGVTIAAAAVYAGCGLPMLTPMSSNPGVTEAGLLNVFRLTNRDDRKGPGFARWLAAKMGKRNAVIVDDGTLYGKGLADGFGGGFMAAGRAVAARASVKVGDTDFRALLGGLPKGFDVLFFAGIREGAYLVRDMRALGLNQLFGCGDGCWSVDAFIQPAGAAALQGGSSRPRRRSAQCRDRPSSPPVTPPNTDRSTTTRRAPTIRRASSWRRSRRQPRPRRRCPPGPRCWPPCGRRASRASPMRGRRSGTGRATMSGP